MSAMGGGGGSNSDISFAGTFASSAFSACFAKDQTPSDLLVTTISLPYITLLPIPILSLNFSRFLEETTWVARHQVGPDQWGNGGLGSDEYEDDV
ncbi:hypothetical protein KIW84_UN0590 [Lathyrus oleraceus]|nr:hypothetical protein KIW84_UN0590 [Pisum sativum]